MTEAPPRYGHWDGPGDELFGGAKAWGSDGPINVTQKATGRVGFHDGGNTFNDAKLSRTQPWRLRYPTPRDLKEQLARSSASDDGV
ncbi:hypothetical protein VMCG_03151 [Cytospora schulzeri]|uniref:Uncharacterized protein n=1 Tax=Cytospora schulzeri TaxID=448051 RepID=A0A423WXN2_9PEZI|nr:hypothetical protein VMCG_03151 [Valsa malicola]